MPRSKTVILGYPVRPAFFEAKREAARDYFGLDPSLPVLLVSGASSGANSLNRAIAGRLADYLSFMQVMHLCGANDEAWLRIERAKLSEDLQQRYHLHAYLHDDMALALAAADLAVMRSGASVLGELPATRLPAILVPGEYEGWDQSNNARYLESEGAAIMLPQSRMDDLYKTVAIVIHDPTRLDAMRGALQDLARPSAANDLARVLLEMAGAKAPA
jgi:UDP-N-acetylglucosamine--N-acetylmuramyl-(pentapeptide) pyrophosphoryl-undecaprenol N-acetylglucosamine transferase